MAIAFDAAANGIDTGTSLTYSHTVGSGSNRYLYVGVFRNGTTDIITGATYNGDAMTLLVKYENTTVSRWNYVFGLADPDSGTNNVVISASASTQMQAASGSYTGVNATGQPDASQGSSDAGGGTTTSVTVTTVAADCWVAAFMKNEAGNYSSGTGTTLRSPAASYAWCDNNTAVAATTAVTLNLDCADDVFSQAVGVSIKPYAPAGPSNVKTWDGVTQSTSIKTYSGTALASVKTWDGVS